MCYGIITELLLLYWQTVCLLLGLAYLLCLYTSYAFAYNSLSKGLRIFKGSELHYCVNYIIRFLSDKSVEPYWCVH